MDAKKYLKGKKIGVLLGGPSSEREISIKTGQAVAASLKGMGFNTVAIDAGADLPQKLKEQSVDFAFISLHGPMGEDGSVQGLLEVMKIPYTGCGVLSSAVSMDKASSKLVFNAFSIPTPASITLTRGDKIPAVKKYPVVVKPATQGSAIGVSIPGNKAQYLAAIKTAFSYDDKILIEEFVAGTEITVGILGDKALPVIEIVPKGGFYDFKSKYQPGQSDHIIPARISPSAMKKSQELALRAFKALGCKAVARVDLIVDKSGKPWVLEINTIPGMTQTSLLPDAAKAAGLSFDSLVLKIVEYSVGPK
ncbi:MAG TPA: D-alanine--D-alanine ligase [Elusimicrobia bacterium]|nr:MAG: hypothetical protein A2278_09295 [Elusimicrobia bacterium RIFOXYA12_FULL_49_49]OGS14978.1 MAG: hypothetical protein A2251_08150 [Elusimicrobia bacterium RIFOXYA2_FULL_47_53]OGS26087.1 MAG: hypothetical protein A2339_02125 [Elusimicrobia bacterium RIFOXYB12_FULL_50_12]OGS29322.1 MAG: hypothetical protein A2323_04080 [Elusimicrobia bacterium RIFOXYB2_FULL_46_23]HBU70325.1 D-alanine--D-alanine ligase [Elusimicrobiota bacterium]